MTAAERSQCAEMVWQPVCSTNDLEPSWGEVALVTGRRLAVFLLGESEVYAVGNSDPRTGAHVMARGIVGSRGDEATVASPLHKDVYSLGSGECFTDADLFLQTYRTRIIGGFIDVEVPV